MAHPFVWCLQRFGLRLGVVVGVAGLMAVGGVAGCTRDDPAFKVSDMAAASELVGTWSAQDKDGKAFTLQITQDTHEVKEGRLAPRGLVAVKAEGAAPTQSQRVPVYTLRAEIKSPPAKDAKAATPMALDLRGYVLTDGTSTQRLLCIQHEGEGGTGPGSMFTLNTHWMLGLSLDHAGERLTIKVPSVLLLLSPSARFLDPAAVASPDAEAPVIEEALKKDAKGNVSGGSFLTNDPDRALAVCRRYGSRPEFWRDSIEFTRLSK